MDICISYITVHTQTEPTEKSYVNNFTLSFQSEKRKKLKMKIRLGTGTILMTVKEHLCVKDKGGF